KPARIVSLDLCTDQLLVELVGRDRIAAVTHLAADAAVSAIPRKAQGIPLTHGAAEDGVRDDPGLILVGPVGVLPALGLLRRLNRNIVIVPLPSDLDGVRVAVRTVAAAVGEHSAGEAMITTFEQRIAPLAHAGNEARPTALIYQVGGSVSGPGSLAEA